MGRTHITDQTLRNYLLGTAPPSARNTVELRLLTNRRFREYVDIVEEELIDDNFILTPRRQFKLLFSQAFKLFLERREPGLKN
jgi:hypothetical protein